jgi:hypothetical protein
VVVGHLRFALVTPDRIDGQNEFAAEAVLMDGVTRVEDDEA